MLILWTWFYFPQPFPQVRNGFKVGMRCEGIDPSHQSLFCVLSIVEVKGFRLRMHFDGYSESYDFWINADNPYIFPPGWCEKNGKKLEPPRGRLAWFQTMPELWVISQGIQINEVPLFLCGEISHWLFGMLDYDLNAHWDSFNEVYSNVWTSL